MNKDFSDQPPNLFISAEERRWAMLCHVSALSGFFVPFGNIVAPMVIWLVNREGMPFVDYNGKEVLNFQINLTIYLAISLLLTVIVVGFFLLYGLGFLCLILTIIGAIKTTQGEYFRYPFTIRFFN